MTMHLTAQQLAELGNVVTLLTHPFERPSLDEWRHAVLESLAGVFDTEMGAFVLPVRGEAPVTLLGRPMQYALEYSERQADDPATRIWESLGRPSAYNTRMLSGGRREVLTHSDIYEVFHKYDVEECVSLMGGVAPRRSLDRDAMWAQGDQPITGLLTLYGDRVGTKTCSDDALALMRMLHPFFLSAIQHVARLSPWRGDLVAHVDASPRALAIYSASGALVHRNAVLTAMLETERRGYRLADAVHDLARRFIALQREDVRALLGTGPRAIEAVFDNDTDRHTLRASGASSLAQGVIVEVDARPQVVSTGASAAHYCGLTARELEVAHLIAKGKSNASVAGALGISVHTTKRHTENVFRKLGVQSRNQVAALMVRPASVAE